MQHAGRSLAQAKHFAGLHRTRSDSHRSITVNHRAGSVLVGHHTPYPGSKMDQATSGSSTDVRPTVAEQRSSSQGRPKGILKNSTAAHDPHAKSLNWNEENLTINELARDSTMKITEPKTPYVRYNAETDEVMDLDKIPGFELGNADMSSSRAGDDFMPSSPSSRSASVGGNSRRGSEASEKMVKVEAPAPSSGLDDDDDEPLDDEAREHRKKFAEMRGGHYRNEAEAMKRAAELISDEESSSGPDSPKASRVPPLPVSNGVR